METDYQELENDLLKRAIEAVWHETGLKLTTHGEVGMDEHRYDATLVVEGYEHLRFAVEIKRWAQQANLGALINQIKQMPMKGMLVADYVNPKMAEKLRELDVPYIDAVGNVYINEMPLYVFVKGIKNNPRNEIVHIVRETQTRGRAFQPTGIKVLYALIRDPQLLNATYREIKDVTGVALGTVGWVINDLKQGGFLIEYNKKHRRLKNKEKLLNKWVEAYLEKLRPKLFIGTFTAENEYWWKEEREDILGFGAKWGGEVAAAKLTGNLKPEKVTIYLPKKGGKELLAKNRFQKDPNGNIQVYRAFWDTEVQNQLHFNDVVDPMIIYADLLATGDPRNLETARILYGKELAGLVRED